MTPLITPVSDNHVGVPGSSKNGVFGRKCFNIFFIVSGSCLVSRQLLSSAATAATKVVGHCAFISWITENLTFFWPPYGSKLLKNDDFCCKFVHN